MAFARSSSSMLRWNEVGAGPDGSQAGRLLDLLGQPDDLVQPVDHVVLVPVQRLQGEPARPPAPRARRAGSAPRAAPSGLRRLVRGGANGGRRRLNIPQLAGVSIPSPPISAITLSWVRIWAIASRRWPASKSPMKWSVSGRRSSSPRRRGRRPAARAGAPRSDRRPWRAARCRRTRPAGEVELGDEVVPGQQLLLAGELEHAALPSVRR